MPGTVKSLAFSPDGQLLLAGTEEPYAGFTRVSGVTGARLSPAVPVGRAVVDMAMSPSGRSAVPVANSLEVGVFDLRERRLRPRILKTGVGCRYAAFLPNGTLVTLNRDAGFRRWDGRTFKEIGEPILLAEADRLDARVFSADGRVAVVWTQPGKLEMVDLWDWRPLGTIPCGDSKSWLALSADGERLAVAEPGAEEVRLYDTATAALLQSWVPGGGKITFAGLSPAGDLLVAGHEDGGVLFKALPSGKVQRVQMEEAVQRVTIRADGKRAVGATLRATLKVWDLEAMTELRYPEKPPGHQGSGHGGRGLLSQFSRDGQRFFTWSSQDKMVRVFKAEDGSQDGPPLEHQDTVTHLAESPDGRMLLTKDMDERVYLWDLERRLQMTEVGLFGNELAARAFSPSGDRVLVAGMAGTVWIWPHPPGLGEHLPESFLDFAEGMGLWRVGADRAFQRVTYAELARARQEVLALPSDACDPRTLKWMKWLAEDPEKRSIWPE